MGQSKKTMYSLRASGTMGYVNVDFKYALPVKHGTPAKIRRKHSHFRPFYNVLNSGAVRLETGNSYTAEITDETVIIICRLIDITNHYR